MIYGRRYRRKGKANFKDVTSGVSEVMSLKLIWKLFYKKQWHMLVYIFYNQLKVDTTIG
jgi:hypothetical protein